MSRDYAGWLNGLQPGDAILCRPWLTAYIVVRVALDDGWVYARSTDRGGEFPDTIYRIHVSEVVMPA